MTLIARPAVSNVIVALAVSLGLLAEAAVRVTAVLAGGVAGAVYVTEVLEAPESVPQAGVQALPAWLNVQDTPSLDGSLATVAENCCMADGFSETLVGDIATAIGAVIVILAEAFLVVFEIAAAVRVIVAGLGTLAGAEYVIAVPEALMVADKLPQALPVHPLPDNVHCTPRFLGSRRTVAVNCLVPPPAWTLALVGETLTLIRDCARLCGTHTATAQKPSASAAVGILRSETTPQSPTIDESPLCPHVDNLRTKRFLAGPACVEIRPRRPRV